MNPRTRKAALHGIAWIAIGASVNAMAHSYVGLHAWAASHKMGPIAAWSWPAVIDVFLLAGELALYVAYLDGWPARRKVWPWLTALVGLAVSVAGNVGHVGESATWADRATAATSPVAAFAGLAISLLVLKTLADTQQTVSQPTATGGEGSYGASGTEASQSELAERPQLASVSATATHRPKTTALVPASQPPSGESDNRRRVADLLAEEPDLSGAEIGRRLGLAARTASRLRNQVADASGRAV